MKAGILAAVALLALAAAPVAAVTLPTAATDHWADPAAAHFPDPETGSRGKDVSGHPTAEANGVPPGPTSWLDDTEPYGPPTWLDGTDPRGPPNWVE